MLSAGTHASARVTHACSCALRAPQATLLYSTLLALLALLTGRAVDACALCAPQATARLYLLTLLGLLTGAAVHACSCALCAPLQRVRLLVQRLVLFLFLVPHFLCNPPLFFFSALSLNEYAFWFNGSWYCLFSFSFALRFCAPLERVCLLVQQAGACFFFLFLSFLSFFSLVFAFPPSS